LADVASLFRNASSSFADVDLSMAEASLQDVAVGSAVNLIASLGSELPLVIYRGSGPGAQTVPIPGNLEDPSGDGYGREDWSYKYLVSHLLRGNAFGDVLDRGGPSNGRYITQVDLFHPDAPSGQIEDGRVVWRVKGQEVPNMWHRRTRAFPGQVMGLSPVGQAAVEVGLSITMTRFGKLWFDEGGVPATVLHNTERDLTGDQARTVKDRFMAAVRGKREPVVLDRGWKLDQVQVAPEESQFLETRQFTSAQCARIFGPGVAELLGYETGGNLTYTTPGDRANDFQKFTLNYWLKQLERAYRDMLPPGLVPRLDRDALLEALARDRYDAYAVALGGVPWMKPSEVRPKEGLTVDVSLDQQQPEEGDTGDGPGTE
jgi:HK97 family phage portal protein